MDILGWFIILLLFKEIHSVFIFPVNPIYKCRCTVLTKEEKYKAHIDVSLKGAHSSSLSTCNFHKKLVIAGFKWNKILQIFHLSRFLIIILLDTYIVRGQDRKVCHLVHSTAWKNLDDKYIKILNYTTKQYLKKVPDEKVWEALCRKFGERGVQTLVEEIDNSFTSIGGNRPVITHGFNKKSIEMTHFKS